MTDGLRAFVLTALLAFLLVLPAAAQISIPSGEVKTPPQAPPPLPDLRVKSIWLSSRCRLGFELTNSGKGGVKADDYADTGIEVRMGKIRKVIPLKSVDPGALLVKPGGRVKYGTDITLDVKRSAFVSVDPGNEVEESNEDNNTLTRSLRPVCKKAADAGKKKKAASPSGTPFPSPAVKKRKAAEAPLKIERVYLAGDKIHAVLVSTGPLPESRYRKRKLQLSLSGKERAWTLAAVDPKRTLQRHRGGKVDFATGISLGSPQNVLFTLTGFGRKRAEVIQVRLVPERYRKTLGAHVAGAEKSAPAATRSSPALMGKGVAAKVSRRGPAEPVLFYEDYGIRILGPSSGETVWLEEPFVVSYRFSEYVDAGETVFRLTCDGDELAETRRRDGAHHPAGPAPGSGLSRGVRRLEWDLPGDLPGGERCIVEAEHGDVRGLSSLFSLGAAVRFEASPIVDLIDPGGAEWWERGTTQTVKWRVYNSTEERRVGGWRFGIHREGEPIRISYPLSGYSARPIRPGVVEFTWNWSISRDVPLADNYLAQIDEILPAGSTHEPLSDASDRTFRVRSRFTHDLEVTDLYIDGRDHLVAGITEHQGPLVGNVRILVEHGYVPDGGGASGDWVTTSSRSRQVTLALTPGGSTLVDLGAAEIPAVDIGMTCGLRYRVTVDSEDWVVEDDNGNNDLTREVYYRRGAGSLEYLDTLGGDSRRLSPPAGIAFRWHEAGSSRSRDGLQELPGMVTVRVRNCSRDPVSGAVRIVQTLSPDSLITRSELTVVDEERTILPGGTWSFGSGAWYVAGDSNLTIAVSGGIAAWASPNPFSITVDRRE